MGVEGKLNDQCRELPRIYCKKPPSTFCSWA